MEGYERLYKFLKLNAQPNFASRLLYELDNNFVNLGASIWSYNRNEYIEKNKRNYMCSLFLLPEIMVRYDIYLEKSRLIFAYNNKNKSEDDPENYTVYGISIYNALNILDDYERDQNVNKIDTVRRILDSNNIDMILSFISDILKMSTNNFYNIGYYGNDINKMNELGYLMGEWRYKDDNSSTTYMIFKDNDICNILVYEPKQITGDRNWDNTGINNKYHVYSILYDKFIDYAFQTLAINKVEMIYKENNKDEDTTN